MRKGDKKIFADKHKLYEAVVLRRSGWSISSIALLQDCDRNSLRIQYRRYGIQPWEGKSYPLRFIYTPIQENILKQTNKWKVIDGQKINTGHSYQEYLEISKNR